MNNKKSYKLLAVLLIGILSFLLSPISQAQTTLRVSWYSDGNEGEVFKDLISRFEAANPDIKVAIDNVAYKAVLENLPVQLAAGEGPDLARVTDLGGLAKHYLDMRPMLSDVKYWEKNFGPFLKWMRADTKSNPISGFMTQLTITGPYVNKTLFEQAGVDLPGDKATWDDWAKAVNRVAKKLEIPIPLAMDRSGHRMAGPAISFGAKFFNEKGKPSLMDKGLKTMMSRLFRWHNDGTMAKELWGSVSGSQYLGANEDFANARVVMYMSGSWQIGQFAKTIGDNFDWWAVPNPCGPAACSGMPGGAALVALKYTKHPKEVVRLMEYLSSEKVLAEFYGRTLFVPGHIGLSTPGKIKFDSESPLVKHALTTFSNQVNSLSPVSYDLQGYPNNRILFNAMISRLGQAIVGEMTLKESFKRMGQDVKKQLAEKNVGK